MFQKVSDLTLKQHTVKDTTKYTQQSATHSLTHSLTHCLLNDQKVEIPDSG
jgi:hypothetical protein